MKGKCKKKKNVNPIIDYYLMLLYIYALCLCWPGWPYSAFACCIDWSVCIIFLADRWWTWPLWQRGGSGWISRSLWYTLARQICRQHSLPTSFFQPFTAPFTASEKWAIRSGHPCKRGLHPTGVGSWLWP